jgi:hypothetical protein
MAISNIFQLFGVFFGMLYRGKSGNPACHPDSGFQIHLLQTGRPVRKTFVLDWMSMMTERVKRVLTMHPEFSGLSQREQVFGT